MSGLVRSPENRFSHVAAQMIYHKVTGLHYGLSEVWFYLSIEELNNLPILMSNPVLNSVSSVRKLYRSWLPFKYGFVNNF